MASLSEQEEREQAARPDAENALFTSVFSERVLAYESLLSRYSTFDMQSSINYSTWAYKLLEYCTLNCL